MPNDDFKLSVDVEANLAKLDATLSVAQQKVLTAGANMQRSLNIAPMGFASGVGTAAYGNAQMGPTGAQGVVFGGQLNATAGNGMAQRGAPPGFSYAASRMATPGFWSQAGSAYRGMLGAMGTLAAGYGAAVTGGTLADNMAMANAGVGPTRGFLGALGMSSIDEALGSLARFGANSTPLGRIGPVRSWLQEKGISDSGNWETKLRTEQSAMQSLSAYGGLKGTLAHLDFQRNTILPRELAQMEIRGISKMDRDAYQSWQLSNIRAQEHRGITLDRVEHRDIQLSTREMMQRAMGMALPAELTGLQREYNQRFAQAGLENWSEDKMNALRQNFKAAKLSALLSGMAPATAMEPNGMALGTNSVQIGIANGQDPDALRFLRGIFENTASGAVVMRN
jgi:hypothetical protein